MNSTVPRFFSRWLDNSWQLLTLPFLLLVTIPLVAMFLRVTPASLWTSLHERTVQQAIQLSLLTSLASVGLTLLLGTPLAYWLAQPHLRPHRLVDTLIDLPTILPPAVAGLALLIAFGRNGLVGVWLHRIGIDLPFTSLAVILAQTFIAAPFYIKSAAIGFGNIDIELITAAALDGANRWQIFRQILVPMSWMSLLSGCAMTWARALGEFGATIIFAGNFPGRTQTMPLAIYIGFEINLDVALTLAVILVGLSFLILITVKTLFFNQMEQAGLNRRRSY